LHRDPFGFLSLYNSGATLPVLTRTANNIATTISLLWSYTGVMLIVGALAVLYLAWRSRFFLLLCLLGPALILWINERYFTRYYTSTVLIFLLCGAVALAELTRR